MSSGDAIEIGKIEALFRYPVKSMRGEEVGEAALGFHGVEGDRRFALRRLEAKGGFPWLTAGQFAGLLGYTPVRKGEDQPHPTHIRTPEGEELELFSEKLAEDVSRRHGHPVQMMQLNHGVFDEAAVSVITASTIADICHRAGVQPDVRRFRPNILLSTTNAAFEEDAWVGGVITFGEGADAPAIHVTLRDIRCVMINLDPDGGAATPAVMKAAVAANANDAGAYATVIRAGRLAVGQRVMLHHAGAAAMPVLQETA